MAGVPQALPTQVDFAPPSGINPPTVKSIPGVVTSQFTPENNPLISGNLSTGFLGYRPNLFSNPANFDFSRQEFGLSSLGDWPGAPILLNATTPNERSEPTGYRRPNTENLVLSRATSEQLREINALYNTAIQSSINTLRDATEAEDKILAAATTDANQKRTKANTLANQRRQDALNGNLPDVETLSQKRKDAETAFRQEVKRVTDEANLELFTALGEARTALNDGLAESRQQLRERESAINEKYAKYNNRRNRRSNRITAEQFDAARKGQKDELADVRKANVQTELELQQTHDLKVAELRNTNAAKIADAGSEQYAAFRLANREYLERLNARTRTDAENNASANRIWASDRERINTDRDNAIATAETTHREAILKATAKRDRAQALALRTRGIALSEAALSVAKAANKRDESIISGHLLALSQARSNADTQLAKRIYQQTVDNIDAKLTLDIAISQQTLAAANQERNAGRTLETSFANEAEKYLGQIARFQEASSNQIAQAREKFEVNQKNFQRTLDKGLASAEKKRAERLAHELQQTRQKNRFNAIDYNLGRISQQDYNETRNQIANQQQSITSKINAAAGELRRETEATFTNDRAEEAKKLSNATASAETSKVTSELEQLTNRDQNAATAVGEHRSDVLKVNQDQQDQLRTLFTTWTQAHAAAELAFQTDQAKSNAAFTIARAKAAAELEVALADEHAKVVRGFADKNPDNLAARQRAGELAAVATHTQSVSTAYQQHINKTAGSDQAVATALAQAQQTLTLDQSEAQLDYNGALWQAVVNAEVHGVQVSEQIGKITEKVELFQSHETSQNQTFDERYQQARFERTLGFAEAYVRSFIATTSRNGLINTITDRGLRSDIEADAGDAFGQTVTEANHDRNKKLIEPRAQLRNQVAELRSEVSRLELASKTAYQTGLNDAEADLARDLAKANAGFSTTVSQQIQKQSTAAYNSIADFSRQQATADRVLADQRAKLATDYEIGLANRRVQSVQSQLDSAETPQQTARAQHSLAVFQARLARLVAVAPEFSGLQSNATAAIERFSHDVVDQTLATELKSLQAETDLAIKRIGLDLTSANQIATLAQSQQGTGIELSRSLAESGIAAQETFTLAINEGLQTRENAVNDASKTAELSRVNAAVSQHRGDIGSHTARARYIDATNAFRRQKAVADLAFSKVLTQAVQEWGTPQTELEYQQTLASLSNQQTYQRDLLQARFEYDQAVADAEKDANTAIVNNAFDQLKASQNANRRLRNTIARIEAQVPTVLATADVDYQRSIAQAEADYHVVIAANELDNARDNASFYRYSSAQSVARLEQRLRFLQEVSPTYVSTAEQLAQSAQTAAVSHERIETQNIRFRFFRDQRFANQLLAANRQYAIEEIGQNTDLDATANASRREFTLSSIAADYQQQQTNALAYRDGAQAYVDLNVKYSQTQAQRKHDSVVTPDVERSDQPSFNDLSVDFYQQYNIAIGVARSGSEFSFDQSLAAAQQKNVKDFIAGYLSTGQQSTASLGRLETASANASQAYLTAQGGRITRLRLRHLRVQVDQLTRDAETINTAVETQYRLVSQAHNRLADQFPRSSTFRQQAEQAAGALSYQQAVLPAELAAAIETANSALEQAQSLATASQAAVASEAQSINDRALSDSQSQGQHSDDARQARSNYSLAVAEAARVRTIALAQAEHDNEIARLTASDSLVEQYGVPSRYNYRYNYRYRNAVNQATQADREVYYNAQQDAQVDYRAAIEQARRELAVSLNQSAGSLDQATADAVLAEALANHAAELNFDIASANADHDRQLRDSEINEKLFIARVDAAIAGYRGQFVYSRTSSNYQRWQVAKYARGSAVEYIRQELVERRLDIESDRIADILELEQNKSDQDASAAIAHDRSRIAAQQKSGSNQISRYFNYPTITALPVVRLGLTAKSQSFVNLSDGQRDGQRFGFVNRLQQDLSIKEVHTSTGLIEVSAHHQRLFSGTGYRSLVDVGGYIRNSDAYDDTFGHVERHLTDAWRANAGWIGGTSGDITERALAFGSKAALTVATVAGTTAGIAVAAPVVVGLGGIAAVGGSSVLAAYSIDQLQSGVRNIWSDTPVESVGSHFINQTVDSFAGKNSILGNIAGYVYDFADIGLGGGKAATKLASSKLSRLTAKTADTISDSLPDAQRIIRNVVDDIPDNAPNSVVSFVKGRRIGEVVSEAGLDQIERGLLRSKVTLTRNADEFLDSQGAGGLLRVYKDGSASLFLRKNPTRYEILHESQHIEHLQQIGAKRYIELRKTKAGNLELEQFVYDNLRRHHWDGLTAAEIKHAQWYIRDVLGGNAW